MDIKLKKDVEQRMIASIRRFLSESGEGEAGDLKATLHLRFFLEELAPSVYNQAVSDAQAFLQERVMDVENVCFAKEFGYWQRGAGRQR